jgi:uncharacterized protein (DUF924 family)
MIEDRDWQTVYDFWFPPELEDADAEAHHRMFGWWFGGEANTELLRFARVLKAARGGRLSHWLGTARGRLALIVVLDQFPRGLFPGSPAAYASDQDALRIAEEGLRNGHYDTLAEPWERTFFFMPLGHTEGPDHQARLERVAAMAEMVAFEAPPHLQPLYQFSARQARGHLEVISRFGRYPHRNPILGRASTPEELAYLKEGNFVHLQRPPHG